ncbi:unnamed protein product [Aureobasidium uvarum]|uniref:Uncharacterized protein n=1 Tax=Aureobasidium uvarum TaxID=2773716 RepID=A0A9N8KUT3_9PEZI|nr:unnamed protein product [Aureobasidium uvarum]
MSTQNDAKGPFILSRATTTQDFSDIVTCEFRTFTDSFIRDLFMGPDTPRLDKSHRDEYWEDSGSE